MIQSLNGAKPVRETLSTAGRQYWHRPSR